MAKQLQLKAKTRAEAGRGPVKRLRATGSVPGVVYGAKVQPLNIAVAVVDLEKVLHHATGENVLVDLLVDEGGQTANRLALIQEVQHHPFEDTILHVDFHEVSATEKLRTAVPVRPVGEPSGVKNGGGVLEHVMRELHVECLPKDLPDVIEINVEKMEIGEGIHVGDVTAPPGVTLLDDKGQTVFIVAAPIAEEEVAAMTVAVEATPSTEPEVIGGEEGRRRGRRSRRRKAKAKPKPAAGKAEAKAPAAAGKAEAKAPAAGKAPEVGKPPAGGKPKAKPGRQSPKARSNRSRTTRRGVGPNKAGRRAEQPRPGVRRDTPQCGVCRASTGWRSSAVVLCEIKWRSFRRKIGEVRWPVRPAKSCWSSRRRI
jgi:large subunit ribosomal protein L25